MRALLPVPFLLLAAPALALTPEELWQAWQAQAEGFGVTLTADAAAGPDGALTLSGFARQVAGGPVEPMPDDAPIRSVTLRPMADGTVAIDLGLPAAGRLPMDDGSAVFVATQGLALAARDDGEGLAYDVAARSFAVSVEPLAGAAAPGLLAWEVTDLALRVPGALAAGGSATGTLALGGFAALAEGADPITGQPSRQWSRTTGRLEAEATLTLPPGHGFPTTPEATAAALRAGLAFEVAMTGEGSTGEAAVEGAAIDYRMTATVPPAAARIAFGPDGFSAESRYGAGTRIGLALPALPVGPVDLAFGPMEVNFAMPLGAAPGPMRLRLALEDVRLGEAAWDALDPGALLPRDPMRLVLDLGGRLTLDLPALIEAQAAGRPEGPPVLDALEGRMAVAVAGLEAEAEGALAFDNATGQPVPSTGRGSARVAGLDRLLDALVALGWLPAEQASAARLGLAVAFRAGDAPDTRVAEVEIGPGGVVTLNGVRMP